MKKNLMILFLSLFVAGAVFAEGSVIPVKPKDFKDSIIICNQSDVDFYCYVLISYKDNTEKYKSETCKVRAYGKEELNFDYDDEWHDLVKDIKKYFNTPDINASSYNFEFHFSEEVILDRVQVVDKSLMIFVKTDTADF